MSYNPEDELETLTLGAPSADWTLILAHGAGQGKEASRSSVLEDSVET